jgi:hypothetical protein
MQLVSPIPGGTIAGAIHHLSAAQGAAADVTNSPLSPDTHARLVDGVRSAKLAAAELFLAEPRSQYQDLVAARRDVIEGQQLLEQAIEAFGQELPAPIVEARVQQLAQDAFNVFEDVFEALYND